jgi:hypothetical protein
VHVPAFDFVCGWTINPSPGTRITVPSMLSVPASASTFVQSSASSSPMRHPGERVHEGDEVVLVRVRRSTQMLAYRS